MEENSKNFLSKIKSSYILRKILSNIDEYKLLQIIRINKDILTKLNKDINDFKKLSYIKLEIIPAKDKYDKFINFDDKNKSHYHIYFNNDKNEEISSTYIKPEKKS